MEAEPEGKGMELPTEGRGEHVAGGLKGKGKGVWVGVGPRATHLGEELECGPGEGKAEVGAHEGVPVEGGE